MAVMKSMISFFLPTHGKNDSNRRHEFIFIPKREKHDCNERNYILLTQIKKNMTVIKGFLMSCFNLNKKDMCPIKNMGEFYVEKHVPCIR